MSYWIIPCNPKMYDVIGHFAQSNQIIWKQDSRMRVDDCVYMYVGQPYSQILYRCTISKVMVSQDVLIHNDYAIQGNRLDTSIKYMELHLRQRYPEGSLKLDILKKHGLTSVQKQGRIYDELISYLDSISLQLSNEEKAR